MTEHSIITVLAIAPSVSRLARLRTASAEPREHRHRANSERLQSLSKLACHSEHDDGTSLIGRYSFQQIDLRAG